MSLTTEEKRELLRPVSREIVVGGDIELVDQPFAEGSVDHDARRPRPTYRTNP